MRRALFALASLSTCVAVVAACVGDDATVSGTSFPDGAASDAAVADGPASESGGDGGAPRCSNPKAPTTIGLFDPASGLFDLFGKNAADLPLYSFSFAAAQAKRPIAGHWTPGADTVGWLASAELFLLNTNAATASSQRVSFGIPGNFFPIAGDWNGDGVSSVGYFDAVPSNFFIKDGVDGGEEDFNVGAAGANALPVAGDWDGDGKTGIGLFVPSSGRFFLKNVPTNGVADITIETTHTGVNLWPIAGDWDGCGPVRVGLYDATLGTFHLLRENQSFAGEDKILFTASAGKGLLPIAGVWARP